jgi:hypothetical protein
MGRRSPCDSPPISTRAEPNGGAINIRGRGLTLQDGSHIQSATGANQQGQGITVQTTEFVDLLGMPQHPAITMCPLALTTNRLLKSNATAGDIHRLTLSACA